jgi:hypothetical protein
MVALSLTTVSAFATDCRVTGWPSAFGVDMTAYFAVRSGETRKFRSVTAVSATIQ